METPHVGCHFFNGLAVQILVSLAIRARTVELPLDNTAVFVASVVGLIDRGHARWKTIRSEVALVTLGDVSIACIPGEVYPEIVNGGVVSHPKCVVQPGLP